MTQTVDDVLLSKFRENQGDGFRLLYERYAAMLLRFLSRFTASQSEAEEIVHDVFVAMISGQCDLSCGRSFKSWMFTVAKNKALNNNRLHQRVNGDPVQLELVADESPNPEVKLHNQRTLCELATFQASLPDDLQKVWNLRSQGYDYSQIAEKLLVPIGTVKSRLHRLVTLLRKEFDVSKY